jgi:hypothetical protein
MLRIEQQLQQKVARAAWFLSSKHYYSLIGVSNGHLARVWWS